MPDVPAHGLARCARHVHLAVAFLPDGRGRALRRRTAGRDRRRAGRRSTGVGPLDGLDARDAWPPLLRPGVMMDLESYDDVGAARGGAADARGHRAASMPRRVCDAATRGDLRRGRPAARVPLDHAVRDAFGDARRRRRPCSQRHEAAVKRWLAARLFGTWIAYQGRRALDDRPLPSRLPATSSPSSSRATAAPRSHPPQRPPDRPRILSQQLATSE